MERAAAEELVRALLDAWNARDLAAFGALLASDVYWHDVGMPHPPAIGREAAVQFAASALTAFPDFMYEIRGPICVSADGRHCVVPWTIRATQSGPLHPPGFAPVNRTVCFDGFDSFEFRDGLVARLETRFDPAVPIEQLLGIRVRPAPGSMAERVLVRLQRVIAWWIRRRPQTGAR